MQNVISQLKALGDHPSLNVIEKKSKELGVKCVKVPRGLAVAVQFSDNYQTELIWDSYYAETWNNFRSEMVYVTCNMIDGEVTVLFS
jgi:hypothetical protein